MPLPRLFHDGPLVGGAEVSLTTDQAHYLRDVLRLQAGADLLLFNDRDGEFEATLSPAGKKGAAAQIGERRRTRAPEVDIQLLFAPVKRAAIDMIVQKATELGVGALLPVVTERTNADRVPVERLRSIAVEASEQCGRLSVPDVFAPRRLADALRDWDIERRLIFCDEAGDDPTAEWGGPAGRAAPVQSSLAHLSCERWALLIGPEGGFSPAERALIRSHPFVTPVTLGPRILRADTAAIVALALMQASIGDLRGA